MGVHLDKFLDVIGTLSICPRVPSTNAAGRARDLIREHIAEAGLAVTEHRAVAPGWKLVGNPTLEILDASRTVQVMPAMLSPPTAAGGVVGVLENADNLVMLDAYLWERLSVLGEDGHVRAFLLSCREDLRVQPLADEAQGWPHVIVPYGEFEQLKQALQIGKRCAVRVDNPTVINGQHTLTSLVTGVPNAQRWMLACAHYDSVIHAPGALDNATGVALLLELARKAKLQDWPIQFAFFDGEEWNKAGSRAYVDSLSEDDVGKLGFVIELDTMGSGDEIALLCSKKLSKPLRQLSLEASVEPQFRVEINPQTKIGFSDVWPFMQRRVRVIRMLTRGPKSANHVIHTPDDTIDRVNMDTMGASLRCAKALILGLRPFLER